MEYAYYECMYLCVCTQSLSCVQLFTVSQTVVQQAPLFMEFSQPKYWSRLPFSTPEDLPNPGIKPTCLMSPALAGGFFITSTTWEAHIMNMYIYCFLNNFYAKAVRLLVTCFRTPKPIYSEHLSMSLTIYLQTILNKYMLLHCTDPP